LVGNTFKRFELLDSMRSRYDPPWNQPNGSSHAWQAAAALDPSA
jgi:hypothetical protein